MRIVSLSPAATEIVCALGLEEQLVAVSAACDWPPEILGRPTVTKPRRAGPGLWDGELDLEALAEARPDLVITGRTGIHVPGGRSIEDVLREIDPGISLLTLEPASLEGIFNSVVSVGAMTEAEDEAIGLVELLREDLRDIEERQAERRDEGILPARIVALGHLAPPLAVGRWIPEVIRRAGGWELLGREGEPARETSWEAIREVDPQILLLMNGEQRTSDVMRAWEGMARPDGWSEIQAVRRGQIFAVDGQYFARPGPRVLDGLAMLAEIIDPDGFVDVAPPNSWSPVSAGWED